MRSHTNPKKAHKAGKCTTHCFTVKQMLTSKLSRCGLVLPDINKSRFRAWLLLHSAAQWDVRCTSICPAVPFVRWQILSINSTSHTHHFKGITLTEGRTLRGRQRTDPKRDVFPIPTTQLKQISVWWWREQKIKDWWANKHMERKNGPKIRSSCWYVLW